jgi:hypothetical protein
VVVRRTPRGKALAVGGLLLAVGAGVGAQLPDALPAYTNALHWAGIALFAAGALLSAYAFLDLSLSSGQVYPLWREDLIHDALRNAPPTSTIRLLQTSFPNAADLIPLLKELLIADRKRFKIHVLLANPFTAPGKEVIAARMRLRDQGPEHHRLEIEDHIEQLLRMKAEVDKAWEGRDHAKLSLEIRLYDHLPFGPQFHIGKESFIGFFVAKHSSIRAPMLRLRKTHGKTWELFRDDFACAWRAAVPYDAASAP